MVTSQVKPIFIIAQCSFRPCVLMLNGFAFNTHRPRLKSVKYLSDATSTRYKKILLLHFFSQLTGFGRRNIVFSKAGWRIENSFFIPMRMIRLLRSQSQRACQEGGHQISKESSNNSMQKLISQLFVVSFCGQMGSR